MGHLPLPSDPLLDSISITYLCAEAYDGGSIWSYPQRVGWEILYDASAGNHYLYQGRKPSDEELHAFIQNYLYFGLLHETFGSFSDCADFIHYTDDGRAVVTTAPLNDHLTRWVAKLNMLIELVGFEESRWWVNVSSVYNTRGKLP